MAATQLYDIAVDVVALSTETLGLPKSQEVSHTTSHSRHDLCHTLPEKGKNEKDEMASSFQISCSFLTAEVVVDCLVSGKQRKKVGFSLLLCPDLIVSARCACRSWVRYRKLLSVRCRRRKCMSRKKKTHFVSNCVYAYVFYKLCVRVLVVLRERGSWSAFFLRFAERDKFGKLDAVILLHILLTFS